MCAEKSNSFSFLSFFLDSSFSLLPFLPFSGGVAVLVFFGSGGVFQALAWVLFRFDVLELLVFPYDGVCDILPLPNALLTVSDWDSFCFFC